ncbi:hypothetical protein WR25_19871 [Diploscapter pachys]|uniref:Cytochrome P450 n=1 Tax=Diploscapter pachys TaxID=2018661 RepID=A0A2A2KXJ9_9BILA|nr:hypothetical protein WR25_19871 [Diploscapter pachys]
MILFSIFLCLIIYFIIKHILEVRKYPPGPISIPILGNLFQLAYYTKKTGSPHRAFKFFKEQHGPIFTIWLGPYPAILICDYELAVEAMVKKGANFGDRWNPPVKGHGLMSSNGDYWVEQRRFTLHTLRNLGVSKNIMERRILDEFHMRFENVKPENAIFINEVFELLTANVINRILFSYGFDEKNLDKFYSLKKRMDYELEHVNLLEACIPQFAQKFSYFKKRTEKMMGPFFDVKNFLQNQITERMEEIKNGTHEVGEEPSDFVDAYLMEIQKMKDNHIESSFSLEALVMAVFDLYFAGQETTAVTLAWAVCYFLNHPDVVERVRNELRDVTGGNRDLSQNDKLKTPYFNATIHEIQRLGNIVTLNLFRQAAEDVEIGGVIIRKGQTVTAQIGNILSDERYFADPDKFNPDRYLSDEKLESQTIPFGIGKRACLGESLARAELYLIVGNLVQRYKLETVDKIPSENSLNVSSIARKPEKFYIRLSEIK